MRGNMGGKSEMQKISEVLSSSEHVLVKPFFLQAEGNAAINKLITAQTLVIMLLSIHSYVLAQREGVNRASKSLIICMRLEWV